MEISRSHHVLSCAVAVITATTEAQNVSTLKPLWTPSYHMKDSTIIMPCNYSGPLNPDIYTGWGLVDIDWSNNKKHWISTRPMTDDETLFEQVKIGKKVSPHTKWFIYRNSIYGYNWYTAVRKILDDKAYEPWFLNWGQRYPGRRCDFASGAAQRCSDKAWWSMQQSPYWPEGLKNAPGEPDPDPVINGLCTAPAEGDGPPCDCGDHPCGFYLFNVSSDVVINGQTFTDWYINDYMLNEIGASDDVSGFFWDDEWTPDCHFEDPGDNEAHQQCRDMNLTKTDLIQLSTSYEALMATLRQELVKRKKFSWQMMWNALDQDAMDESSKAGTCPSTMVTRGNCAATLRKMCKPTSPPQVRAMMYRMTPQHASSSWGCQGTPIPIDWQQDLANFLLIRGEFAWIGFGWFYPCQSSYQRMDEMDFDPGVPIKGQHGHLSDESLDICYETAPNSGVFQRHYSKANVTMDCNSWEGSVQWFHESL